MRKVKFYRLIIARIFVSYSSLEIINYHLIVALVMQP